MDQLAIARRAIQDEVSALSGEIKRLEGVLAVLDRAAPTAAKTASIVNAPDFHKIKAPSVLATPQFDGHAPWPGVFEIIQGAGRKGIKALALASQLKKAGKDRPTKEQLVASGKIKVSGKGGGTTYAYVG